MQVSTVKALRNKKKFDGERLNSFYNPINGTGGDQSNMNATEFQRLGWMSQEELDALYDQNWLAKRAVDAPVADMFSNGVEWVDSNDSEDSNQNEIDNLENKIEEVDMWGILENAFCQKRLHWGSAIWFDYGDDPEIPLITPKYERIQKIEVFNSWQAVPTTYYNADVHGINHPKLGEPEHYYLILQKPGFQRTIYVHESRLLVLKGLPPSSSRQSVVRRGWGFSILEAMNEALKGYGVGIQSGANVLQEFWWKILQIDDLAQLIIDNEDDLIIKRSAFATRTFGNENIGVYGRDEQLTRTGAPVTGFTDILDRLANQACAAAHPGIPFSILFSAEGGALAGTSAESDIRNYYKRIRGMQNKDLRPAVNKFLYFIGEDPKRFPFVFNNLNDPTLKEEIELLDKASTAYSRLIQDEVLIPEEVTEGMFGADKIRFNQIKILQDLRDRIEREREESMNEEEEVVDNEVDSDNTE